MKSKNLISYWVNLSVQQYMINFHYYFIELFELCTTILEDTLFKISCGNKGYVLMITLIVWMTSNLHNFRKLYEWSF